MLSLTRFSAILPPGVNRLLRPLAMPFIRIGARRLYSQFISKGDLVFDIGANEGELTDIFLSFGAKVICVEPNPDCVRILEKKYGKRKDVSIVPMGAGKEGGTLRLFISGSSSSLSTFSTEWKSGRFSGTRWDREITVGMTTLDALVDEYGKPSYCKIDVEGYEKEVLQGLNSQIPALSFEFTREFMMNARRCVYLLSSLGYKEFNYSRYSEFRLSSKAWLEPEALFSALEGSRDPRLCGDIFARI